jgi:quercetin dioxygenase-like cupin family protein
MGTNPMSDQKALRNEQGITLPDLAHELLAEAAGQHSRRSARTVASGSSMRATVIALLGGAGLAEHEAPPAATLQVLTGSVDLVAGERRWPLGTGDLAAIPQERHSLLASTDAVVLLTVALHRGP